MLSPLAFTLFYIECQYLSSKLLLFPPANGGLGHPIEAVDLVSCCWWLKPIKKPTDLPERDEVKWGKSNWDPWKHCFWSRHITTFKKYIICMVYGLRELKNKSWDNSEWVKNGDFCYYLMRLIATWGASCRHDSASPKTGAWLSLVLTSAPTTRIWYHIFT